MDIPETTKTNGLGLERSDVAAICVGIIVAVALYLEPQKTPAVVVACLLALALCVGYLLFHWIPRWLWFRSASAKQRRVRLALVGLTIAVLSVVYVRHVWPQEDPAQKKMEQILLGEEYDPTKLATQFPLGYIVFKLKNDDKVVFYKGLSLIESYDFDWDAVSYISNSEDKFQVRMPDVVPKMSSKGVRIVGNQFGGPKRVGFWFMYYETADFRIVDEVLDVDKDGVVFVIGLMKPREH
jgi:hypothetical protein